MSTLEIKVEPLEGVDKGVIVHLGGALDQPTRDQFLNAMKSVISDGMTRCILDMEHVTYANSTAIGDLVIQFDQFHEKGGELVLMNLQNKVYSLMEIVGVNSVLPITKTMEDARAQVSARPATEVGGAPPGEPPPGGPAPATPSFPLRAECAGCAVTLEFAQPGRYRCPHCNTVYTAQASGQIASARARGGQVIEVMVPCQPRILRAFQQFVAALPNWRGYTDLERARLEKAIAEICDVIHQQAYDGNNDNVFHVLILTRDEELALRVADHGRPLNAAAFPGAAQYMTEFEHKARPPRGNVLRMAKRVARG
ncbi:MAG TPA: anti-sigma factor antagonist [Planctomycetota bacterium]|nr:anti-sigma factor antagonist [Planctomycetota bacterium]